MTDTLNIIIHKTSDNAVIPTVAYGTSAGFDITCTEDTVIPAHSSCVVPNGLNVTIPDTESYYMEVHLRSSLGFKKELVCHPGVVDAGYCGDLGVKIYNLGNTDVAIGKGDRYAQLVVHKVPKITLKEMNDFEYSIFKATQTRGTKGFGSSNTNGK